MIAAMGHDQRKRLRIAVLIAATLALALAAWRLEAARGGIEISRFDVGTTPATLFSKPGADGPLVIVAHGFAGSRQLMHSHALALAHAGYNALAFDLEGHGRNEQPMRGDVSAIDGTTRYLVEEIIRVAEAGRQRTGFAGEIALIGHSMASDLVIRAALEMERPGPVIAISMFSQAVTPDFPRALLAISGQWEAGLRAEALRVLHMVDPQAEEGETAEAGDVIRRAAVAPLVGHVGVLFQSASITETVAWLDAYYAGQMANTSSSSEPPARGLAILLMFAAILAQWWAIAPLLPQNGWQGHLPLRGFLAAFLLPALLTPLLALLPLGGFIPVLVADYLAVHLFVYGLIQLVILYALGIRPGAFGITAFAGLLLVGGLGLGALLDRHVASFTLTGERWLIMAAILPGAAAFMLADSLLSEAGRAALWRRLAARIAFLASLVLAAMLDLERLMFLLIILPVIVLFFLVYGFFGRQAALRSGPLSPGLALGLILAWSLAATFPLFQP